MNKEQFKKSKQHLKSLYKKNDLMYLSDIRKASRKAYPEEKKNEWFLIQHMTAGMAIRNELRTIYTDDEINGNWDDHYMDVLNSMLDDYDKEQIKQEKKEKEDQQIQDFFNFFKCEKKVKEDKYPDVVGNQSLYYPTLTEIDEVFDVIIEQEWEFVRCEYRTTKIKTKNGLLLEFWSSNKYYAWAMNGKLSKNGGFIYSWDDMMPSRKSINKMVYTISHHKVANNWRDLINE